MIVGSVVLDTVPDYLLLTHTALFLTSLPTKKHQQRNEKHNNKGELNKNKTTTTATTNLHWRKGFAKRPIKVVLRRPHNNKVELNHLEALGAESLLVFCVELPVKLLSEKEIIVILTI